MAYNGIEELPAALKNNLPKDAMEVYVAAYNQAWTHSAHMKFQGSGISIEAIAHRKAWGAVRDKYRKQGQEWVRIFG